MSEVCPRCGLPRDLCICGTIAKEKQRIRVRIVRRRYRKAVTLVEGLEKSVDVKDIAKKLKEKFACGGTVKKGIIELQGDHRKEIKGALVKLGFLKETIEIS